MNVLYHFSIYISNTELGHRRVVAKTVYCFKYQVSNPFYMLNYYVLYVVLLYLTRKS